MTCNINNAFGPGTANEHSVHWWVNKFCRGDKSLEDKECHGWSSEVDNKLRGSSKLILLQQHEKLLKNSTLIILWLFGIWSKLERWKSSISGCLVCWPKSRKLLKCRFFLLYTTMNHFSISLRNEKWILYDSRYVQLSGWTEKLQSTSQSQCCTKKDDGHCLVLCRWSVPLQLSESQWDHYIWEVCSANWWGAPKTSTPAAGIGQQKGPNSSPWQCPTTHHTPMLHKFYKLGYEVWPHLPYSPDLSPTDHHFFKHLANFVQGKCFHNQQKTKNTFQEFMESCSMDFYATGISKLNFLLAKMCWL